MTERLGSGDLRRMVAKTLSEWQDENPPTAGQIARELVKSSGAVRNALNTLAKQGAAKMVQGAGGTAFIATATTADAARGAVLPTVPPPSAPTTPATPGVSGPIVRPNGQKYHPRTLAGMPDADVLNKMRAAEIPVLLYGPPGTGKTSVIEAAFADAITVQGDGDTTVADFVGEYTQKPDGTFVFVHGPLIRAMREGRALFVDDATLIPPQVMAVLYPAMDGRKEVIVKANGGEIVKAEPGFYVVAGHNPGVHGAVLSDALSSRFSYQVEVTSDYELAKKLGVDTKAVKAARNLAVKVKNGECGWAPQLRELLGFKKISAVLGVEAAAGNLVAVAPEEDREIVAEVVKSAFGIAPEPPSLGAQVKF